MASPQKENGHLDIANEIIEALCRLQLSGYESRLLWAIFRKTYGWNKKEDAISLSQFQGLTDLDIPKISNTLKRLDARHIIITTNNGAGKTKSYCFQKDYTLWDLPKSVIPKSVIPKSAIPEKGITQNPSQVLPISASTKDTITKDNVSKIEATFIKKEFRLKELFPDVDYEVEKEKIISKYTGKPVLDAWQLIMACFQRAPKGDSSGRQSTTDRSGKPTRTAPAFTDSLTEEFCKD